MSEDPAASSVPVPTSAPAPKPQGRLDAHTGQRYLTRSEGAPPLPPPGGYRGARRVRGPEPAGPGAAEPGAVVPARPRPGVLGWIALGVSALFAAALILLLAFGATDAIYSATAVVLQLLVVGVLVAALLTPRGRVLGAWGLALALMLNVGTVGALGAMRTSAEGGYAGAKTDEERHLEAYPGISGEPAETTLSRTSLEDARALADSLSAEIRDELSAEYGFTWTERPAEDLRPERNGHGGESMLVRFTSATASTNEPIHDYETKLAVMDSIQGVLTRHDWWELYAFNEPGSGMDPSLLEKFYGSDDPKTQVAWEWYTQDPTGDVAFYASIVDLSQDTTGDWREDREVQSGQTGEPVEGLQISFYAERLLSEADHAEFERRMAEYE